LKTPTSQLAVNGGSQHPDKRKAGGHGPTLADEVEHLLPTPAVNDMGAAYTPDEWDAWTDRMKAEHGNGNGHGKSLSIEAARLLPTPRTQNNENRQSEGYGGEDGNFHGLLNNPGRWGEYAAAIARWEAVLGRPAPDPTMTSTKGNPQLSPKFVEHMMGLPAGWVTDVPGITRNEALKALGNGVVPQQAEAALRILLTRTQVAA
jgi:DNA (cytosine-5)-methyltransferase 1